MNCLRWLLELRCKCSLVLSLCLWGPWVEGGLFPFSVIVALPGFVRHHLDKGSAFGSSPECRCWVVGEGGAAVNGPP